MNVKKVIAYLDKQARKDNHRCFEAYTMVCDRIESRNSSGLIVIQLLQLAEEGAFK